GRPESGPSGLGRWVATLSRSPPSPDFHCKWCTHHGALRIRSHRTLDSCLLCEFRIPRHSGWMFRANLRNFGEEFLPRTRSRESGPYAGKAHTPCRASRNDIQGRFLQHSQSHRMAESGGIDSDWFSSARPDYLNLPSENWSGCVAFYFLRFVSGYAFRHTASAASRMRL